MLVHFTGVEGVLKLMNYMYTEGTDYRSRTATYCTWELSGAYNQLSKGIITVRPKDHLNEGTQYCNYQLGYSYTITFNNIDLQLCQLHMVTNMIHFKESLKEIE